MMKMWRWYYLKDWSWLWTLRKSFALFPAFKDLGRRLQILSGSVPSKPATLENGKKKRGRPRKVWSRQNIDEILNFFETILEKIIGQAEHEKFTITSREDKDTFFCPYSIPSYTHLPQVPEDLHKLKKTLSDKTKRKIAENNRKFSVCKLCRWKSSPPLWWSSLRCVHDSHHHLHVHLLQQASILIIIITIFCSKQCRGFRGLVDHMHNCTCTCRSTASLLT